jgi:molybdate transport system ATP-binding protein
VLDIEIDIFRGEFHLQVEVELKGPVTAICGASGSGKTSLLQSIAGLLPSRKILLRGKELSFLPPHQRGIGFVPQGDSLFPHLSVGENLEYGGKWRFDEVISVLELSPLLSRKPRSLSGGERRRVAVGRALCSRPTLLLLDEPLTGLDLPLKERVLSYLSRIHREFSLPVLYVSHQPEEILEMAQEGILLEKGRAVQVGSPLEVLDQLGGGDYRNFYSLSCDGEGREVSLGGQIVKLPSAVSGRVELSIRAQDVLLAIQKPEGLSARNIMEGCVKEVRFCGDLCLVTVDIGVPLVSAITPEAREALEIHPGDRIFCIVKATSIRRVHGEDS